MDPEESAMLQLKLQKDLMQLKIIKAKERRQILMKKLLDET